MLSLRLTLGRGHTADMKKISKREDFPDANPGDVVFVGFIGIAHQNAFLDGRDDHLFLASPQFVFTGQGRCYYGLEIEFPVGTPVQVVWTTKGFEIQKLDVRAEYSFDLLNFLRDYQDAPDLALDRLGTDRSIFAQPNQWTRIWRLAAAPLPWQIMHKLLLVEITAGCPDDKFGWEQSVAPQQVLVLEGHLYQTVTLGQTPISYCPGQFHSIMGGSVQHVRTNPIWRTRFLVFYTGPQYSVEAPTPG